jgi:flagellar protein FlgJ
MGTYTYEKKLAFIKELYCPARQVADETGCSWQLILAQAAQETGWGEKILAGTNNIFNIKASPDWNGDVKTFNVWEIVAGNKIWVNAPFRVYASILDSLRDRQKFLEDNKRYRRAGLQDEDVKGDLVKEAQALQRAGYATDPSYAAKLQEVFDGKTMQSAIAEAKKQGCKGCLPTINLYIRDAARVALANTKVRASQGHNSRELVTDDIGHVQIQAALSGGRISIDVWSEHESKWIAIMEKVTPTSPPTVVAVVAPTLMIALSTERHEPATTTAEVRNQSVQSHTSSGSPLTAADENVGHYIIERGDSLSKIAKKYSTSYLTLARLNGISSPHFIFPGQTLKVPKRRHAAVSPDPVSAASISSVLTAEAAQRAATPHLDAHNAVHAVRHRNEANHPQTDLLSARRAPWMAVAELEFRAGVRRRGGVHPDQHIVEYFSATSLGTQRSDNLAYCAAFVNWCLTCAGYQGNNSAGANSLSTWGRPTRNNKPAYRAIAVVHFPTGGHHVTFVNGMAPSRPNALRIATLGGNQGHAHEVSHSAVPASWVTHYRFPTGYAEHDEDYELEQSSVDSAQMSATSTH